MDKHPFSQCFCKHKQASTDVPTPISTTSGPGSDEYSGSVNTSVFLPEPNETLIWMLFFDLINHRLQDTRLVRCQW